MFRIFHQVVFIPFKYFSVHYIISCIIIYLFIYIYTKLIENSINENKIVNH
jgi:hypothetical protein